MPTLREFPSLVDRERKVMTFAERFEAGVLSRNCLRAGFLLIWTSVLIIPIGTYLQIKAPGFEKYQKKLEAEITPMVHPTTVTTSPLDCGTVPKG